MARILVLEDNDYIRTWYARELASEGHEVLQAVRLDEALEELRRSRPDFVVMDITYRAIDRAHEVMLILIRDSKVRLILNIAHDRGQAHFVPLDAHAHFARSSDLSDLKRVIHSLLAA